MDRQSAALMQRMVAQAVAREVNRNNPENLDAKRRDFYIYEAEALALAAGGTANDVINIEADSRFILQKLSYQADIAAAAYTDSTRPWPNVSIQLVDTGSGRQLMQNPIPLTSFMGTGELPFYLPNPRAFDRNSTIQVAFTNFDAAVTYNIRLAFIGYKIYGTA
jgi:hypothetical protein